MITWPQPARNSLANESDSEKAAQKGTGDDHDPGKGGIEEPVDALVGIVKATVGVPLVLVKATIGVALPFFETALPFFKMPLPLFKAAKNTDYVGRIDLRRGLFRRRHRDILSHGIS